MLNVSICKYAAIMVAATCCLADSAVGQVSQKGTVVVYPVLFKRHSGSEGGRTTAAQAVKEVFQKDGYTLVSSAAAASTWKKFRFPLPATDQPPTKKELTKLGKTLSAKYVVYAAFDFHSRSIWVTSGPKTISTAITDITILDSGTGKIIYSKKGVQARSDEKEKVIKLAAAVLVSPLVTAVSGGPKTPQEQRAAQLSVGEALAPWIKRH